MENNFIPKGLLNCSRQIYKDDEHVLLKYKDSTSDKFWAAIPDDGSYIIIWGKNGKKPQKSQILSKSVALTKINSKLAKGYTHEIKNELLNHFQTNPQWFVKVSGSSDFNTYVRAQSLTLKMITESKSNNFKTTKTKI